MMRALPIGLLLSLVGLSSGCVDRFLDFRVERLVGVEVTQIDRGGFDLQVRCELVNPNPVSAEISQIRYRTFLGTHLLGSGQLSSRVPVASRSRFLLTLPMHVAYADLPADFPERVKGGSLLLRTVADFHAKAAVGSFDMHLVSEGTTRVADALQVAVQGPFQAEAVRVEKIYLSGLELRAVRLRLRLIARNLFAFPVGVQRGEFSLEINGSFFGKSALRHPLSLAPRSSVPFEVDVVATHGAIGSAIAAMMGSQPIFRVKGTLWIDPIGGVRRIPIDVRADSSIFGK
jgi:LEA14-like dessication related protein